MQSEYQLNMQIEYLCLETQKAYPIVWTEA